MSITTLEQPNIAEPTSLSEQVSETVKRYFTALEGDMPNDLYELVLTEVEIGLLTTVMQKVNNNQSKAARLLGLARGTLRTKLKQHFGDRYCGTRD